MGQFRNFVGHWLVPPGLTEILQQIICIFRPDKKSKKSRSEINFYTYLKYGTSDEIAAFPVKDLRYQGGTSFSINQHHFVRFFEGGKLELERFYDRHQPKNVLEEHFIYNMAGTTTTYIPPVGFMPWRLSEEKYLGEFFLNESHGHQAYGPVSPKKVSLEAKRLSKTLKSINKHGYVPELFDGYPAGTLLINDINSTVTQRFLISGGQHRVAALSYLGYTELLVTFLPQAPRVIRISEIETWPGVASGVFSKELAFNIFNSYFRDENTKLLEGY